MAMLTTTTSMMPRLILLGLLGSAVLGPACSERTTQTREMTPAAAQTSAEEERARAREHERMAERAEEQQQGPEKKGALERDQLRRQEEMHREHARMHERLASEMESFEAEECRSLTAEQRASCPLLGPTADVTTINGGVRLTFSKDTDTSQVLSQMRCHAAFAKAHGYVGMESCPLYHRGMKISAEPNGRSIDLTSDDPTVAAEIEHEAELHFGR